ncbi:uncharacterized protein A4U43_C03F28030 [Asparagus officinalis]|uniref:Uncharacterized protein n=1 Tax=Asparagus officinalis TaxID=4686 RepID=A0A5P1FEB9_ASPOF|nr:uncharacterized protein A4U43_C03F28030 [Asparagus officinalis]
MPLSRDDPTSLPLHWRGAGVRGLAVSRAPSAAAGGPARGAFERVEGVGGGRDRVTNVKVEEERDEAAVGAGDGLDEVRKQESWAPEYGLLMAWCSQRP